MTGIFSLPSLDIDPTASEQAQEEPQRPGPVRRAGRQQGRHGRVGLRQHAQQHHARHRRGRGRGLQRRRRRLQHDGRGGHASSSTWSQSGASGGDYVLAGSVATTIQNSDTLAQLGNTARVTGRDARLYAGDLTTNANWVGGIASGESLGVGFSIAVNDIDRKTRAVIGDPDATEPVPAADSYIDVTDKVERPRQGGRRFVGRSRSPARRPPPSRDIVRHRGRRRGLVQPDRLPRRSPRFVPARSKPARDSS